MNPIRIVSLTHSDDFDGIGSQALLYRYFSILHKSIPSEFGLDSTRKIELALFQADYQDYLYYWAAIIAGYLQRTMKQSSNFESLWESVFLKLHGVKTKAQLRKEYNLVSSESKKRILEKKNVWKSINLVILSDIGYNKTFKTLFPILEDLRIPLVYFDHHNHDDDTRSFFSSFCKVYRVDTSYCATKIIYEYFYFDDDIAEYIAQLGEDTDFGSYNMEYSREIMSIISHYRKNFKELCEIVKNCAQGVYYTPKLAQTYKDISVWEDTQVQKMTATLKTYELQSPVHNSVLVIMGISELRSGRSMNRLEDLYTEEWLKTQKPTFSSLLILTLDSTSLNTNIKSNTINVHLIAEYFGGGGHTHRAGFRFPSKYITTIKKSCYVFSDLDLQAFIDTVQNLL